MAFDLSKFFIDALSSKLDCLIEVTNIVNDAFNFVPVKITFFVFTLY